MTKWNRAQIPFERLISTLGKISSLCSFKHNSVLLQCTDFNEIILSSVLRVDR